MMSTILKPLKNRYPHAEITLLSKSIAKSLFTNSDYISHFVSFVFPWTKFYGKYKLWQWNWSGMRAVIRNLRSQQFDIILDARGDIRNNFLSYFIKAKRCVGYDWLGGGYFLTDNVNLKNEDIHRIEAWKKLLEHIGVISESARPFLHISKEEKKRAQAFLFGKGITEDDKVIGIHPGARNKARRWPLEQFERLVEYVNRKYEAKIIVFISPDNYGDNLMLKGHVVKLKLELRTFIAVMDRVNILICNDGGAMHIATALKKPLITVFGPTNPQWFSPYGDNNVVIIKDKVKCRPCFDYCRYREPFCITTITFGEVIQKLDNKIASII